MGWGVVEDKLTRFPPGTVRLSDKSDEPSRGDDSLKKKNGIVLQPQPSDDPNDPLNWSGAWKYSHILVLTFGSGTANALTTMLTPGIGPLVDNFHTDEGTLSTWVLTATTFWTGIAAFFVVSAANVWGRRWLYVLSTLILAVMNLVAFLSKSFSLLVIARTVMGVASAPLLSLITASVADIFFVHERGMWIAIWTLFLNAGGQLGQVVAGFIIEALGVPASFALAALVLGLTSVVAYFVVLESGYFKPRSITASSGSEFDRKVDEYDDEEDLKISTAAAEGIPSKVPYVRRLALFSGRLSDNKFWMGSLKPLGMLASPVILYNTILTSVFFLLVAGGPILSSILLAAEPYNLTPSQIGLTGLPLLVAITLGGPPFGWLSDFSVRYMARTNGTSPGVAEPEFRLVLLLLTVPITAVGLVGTGVSFDASLPLVWVLVWQTTTLVGSTIGTQVAITYVVDCFPTLSAQAFASINVVAALVVFAGTSPLIAWLTTSGPLIVFVCLASGLVIVATLALPLYVFGKRIRAAYARMVWFQRLIN